MAQDEDVQDQGQPESQPPGGGGFISLDQARATALAHARDNQDFYGRRYRKKELAWEVLDQEEREDGYRIRLSYQSRRIVSEPVKKGGFLGCGLVAVATLLLVTVMLAAALGSTL